MEDQSNLPDGRSRELLKEHGITPDIFISSSGFEAVVTVTDELLSQLEKSNELIRIYQKKHTQLRNAIVYFRNLPMTYLDKGADFSECGKYRYCLRRIWDFNLPLVMCIGLNPSSANGEQDDPTIRNLTELLSKSGYGGLFMMNLFALISSEPDDLRSCPDPVKDNDRWLEQIGGVCDDVIFCWGSFKQADYRAKKVVDKFPKALCFGKTAKGKPMHPLAATVWMRSKCKLQLYNV